MFYCGKMTAITPTREKEAAGKPAKIIDFDGTLFFTDPCMKEAAREIIGTQMPLKAIKRLPLALRRQIHCASHTTRFAQHSKPNMTLVNHLRNARDGIELVLVSARSNNFLEGTTALAKTTGIPFAKVILRESLDVPTAVWKRMQLEKLLRRYSSLEVYEDRKKNLAHFMEHLP